MGSRIREDVSSLFICFCEVARPENSDSTAWIIQKHPESYNEEQVLSSIPKFTYPCPFENNVIQYFSFVLTNVDSKWTFGFCRHDPNSPTALVFLSHLPIHEFFIKVLDKVAELIRSNEANDLALFLDQLYSSNVPEQGTTITLSFDGGFTLTCTSSTPFKLPCIPESRIITEYYNAVDINNMLIIFASMLYERRIVITSRKLYRLSACIQAANTLIYPMHWQHIYIPVLPTHLTDYLLAPMPFLIGVPTVIWEGVKKSDIGDIVVIDVDTNEVHTPFRDLDALPQDVIKFLKSQLKNRAALLDDGFARTFLKALVQIIGGYRDALKFSNGKKITFNEEAFIETRPANMQPFLRDVLHLQIFQQFIEERLDVLNSGLGFSDEFEFESFNYNEKSGFKIKAQYKEWVNDMRGRGAAFLKTVKNKANPAMKSAVKTVKERGKDVKTAYRDIRSKMKKDSGARNSRSSDRPIDFSGRPNDVGGFQRTHPMIDTSLSITPGVTYNRRVHTSLVSTRPKEYAPLSPEDLLSINGNVGDEDIPVAPEIDIDLMGDLQEMINRQCTLLDKQQDPLTQNRSRSSTSSSGHSSTIAVADHKRPPVDRTLKPVRSLDVVRFMESTTEQPALSARVQPLNPRRLSRITPLSDHTPLSRISNSLPLSPTSSSSISKSPSFNPFTFQNPFNSEFLQLPTCATNPTNPFLFSVANGGVVTPQCQQNNGTTDLIRLDSEETSFDPLSRESSDDSIKFKTGLMNPLYPFYTPSPVETGHMQNSHPPANSSFLHASSTPKIVNINKKDLELLKEYGIDFHSTSSSQLTNRTSSTCSPLERNISVTPNNDPFDCFETTNKTNAPGHWDTFD